MNAKRDAVLAFEAWCQARGVAFKDTKAGRGEARQAFKVWYLMRAEEAQKVGAVRRELEYLKRDLA